MKFIRISKTKPYEVGVWLREKDDAKSARSSVSLTVVTDPCDLRESQALNLIDSLETAIAKLRFAPLP